MGEAKRRREALAAGKAWRPTVTVRLDESDVGQQIGATLGDEEKRWLRSMTAQFRALARETLQQARGRHDVEGQCHDLFMMMAGANFSVEHQVDHFFKATPDGARMKQAVACRKGCSFCCHVNVSVTIVEAVAIAGAILFNQRIDLIPPVLEAAPKMAGLDPSARQARRIACPLLKDGECSIYEIRPGVCRAYMSTSAKDCEDDLESRVTKGVGVNITTVGLPRLLTSAAAAAIKAASADEGLQDCSVELTGALNLIFKDDTVIGRWLKGEQAFEPYLA